MRYILFRIAYAVLVLFLVSVVTFVFMRAAPGDVVSSLLNPVTATPETIARVRAELGLDQPLLTQYLTYMKALLSGDAGFSLVDRTPVSTLIAHAAGYTVLLAASAFVVTFGVGVPVGVLAAIRRGGIFDRTALAVASLLLGIPNFVLALGAVALFGVKWGVLPVSGAGSPASLVLPTLVLAAEPCALTMRVTRTAVLEEMSSDYARTLRARGVRERRITWVHVLRNAMSPIISLGAIQVRNLLGYALIVEVIFRWPGLGSTLVHSVLQRDYAVAQTLALLLATVVIVASVIGDIAHRWVDPRVRLEGSEAA